LLDSQDDSTPLFTAVQLVRLRDRMKGSCNVNYGHWLEAMEGPELDFRRLAAGPVSTKKRKGGGRKGDAGERTLWGLFSFERDFALWRDIYVNETTTIAKLLGLLADLQLNVSSELEELKSLNQRNEDALQRMDGFTTRLRAIVAGEKAGGFEDSSPVYRELLGIAESLEKLKARVDEKAEDAIRLVSLMTPAIDSQTLIDLLTGEVSP